MTSYTNEGQVSYDFALNGVPFLDGESPDFPYTRKLTEAKKQQINTSNAAGEQGLQEWWQRTQTNFLGGAGAKYIDGSNASYSYGKNELLSRAYDSNNVDLFHPNGPRILPYSLRLSGLATLTKPVGTTVGCVVKGSTADTMLYVTYSAGIPTVAATYTFSSAGDHLRDFTANSSYESIVYVVTDDHLYSIDVWNNITTSMYNITTSSSSSVVRYLKDRIFVLDSDIRVYPVVGTTGNSDVTAMLTALPDGLTWTDAAEGPSGIYFTASDGSIYYSTVEVDSTTGTPVLSVPVSVAAGIGATSLVSYQGSYLFVMCDDGVRVAIFADNGTLVVGPLMLNGPAMEIDYNGTATINNAVISGDYLYVSGWTGSTPYSSGGTDYYPYGVFKLDLSQFDSNTLTFPYAKDAMYSHAASQYNIGYVSLFAGRVAFTDNSGIVVQNESLAIRHTTPSLQIPAWIQTPAIRMDTTEDKVFQKLRVVNKGDALSTIDVYSIEDTIATRGTTTVSLGNTGTTSDVTDMTGSSGVALLSIAYKFYFNLGATGYIGPIFEGYTAKSVPVNIKHRIIRVSLLCYEKETPVGGREINRPVYSRLAAVAALGTSGMAYTFQDFKNATSEDVFVEDVQFISSSVPVSSKVSGRGGTLVVTMRTVA